MNLVFIYLGEECLVIIYSASELAMGIFDVILQPGSQFEARNFEYLLKVEDPDIGKFSYEGTVRSLDDDKNNIYETGLGLSIPHGVLKKLLQDNHFYFEVKIKDLKAELNKGEDSQIPMSDKEDD